MSEHTGLTRHQQFRLLIFAGLATLLIAGFVGLRSCIQYTRFHPSEPLPSPTQTAVFIELATANARATITPASLPTPLPANPTTQATPEPESSPAPAVVTLPDQRLITSGAVVLYLFKNDLWRTDLNGALVERLTEGELLKSWELDLAEDGDPWWANDAPPFVHVSPDGHWIAFSQDGRQLVIVDVTSTQSPHSIRSDGTTPIAWSPDSGAIAFHQGSANGLALYHLQTGLIQTLTAERPFHIVWSPDGRTIGFDCCFRETGNDEAVAPGLIRQIHLETGVVETVGETWRSIAAGPPPLCWTESGLSKLEEDPLPGESCSLFWPYINPYSPDGLRKAALALHGPDDTDASGLIRVHTVADDAFLWEQKIDITINRLAWSPDGRHLLLGTFPDQGPIWRGNSTSQAGFFIIVPEARFLAVVPSWQAAP